MKTYEAHRMDLAAAAQAAWHDAMMAIADAVQAVIHKESLQQVSFVVEFDGDGKSYIYFHVNDCLGGFSVYLGDTISDHTVLDCSEFQDHPNRKPCSKKILQQIADCFRQPFMFDEGMIHAHMAFKAPERTGSFMWVAKP